VSLILINQIANKPVIFDETVYFLSFDDEGVTRQTFELVNSLAAINFYSSSVFWDEKRPLKSSVLNCRNLALQADGKFLTAQISI
jgi:hypothetical protein